MAKIGYNKEATFCRLIRNWYRAQDECGISCEERHHYEQELRTWLLNNARFDLFPPYGRYVKDIPVTLFEGFLIHIDRRAQMYIFTGGSYNARSIGTLDNENLFGAFQDWDSKETGVLRAEEVPTALYTACDLYQTRLNTARDHVFDLDESRHKNPKRKKGTISEPHEPAKGTVGVRAERYTVNEAKILPHIRAGIHLPAELS